MVKKRRGEPVAAPTGEESDETPPDGQPDLGTPEEEGGEEAPDTGATTPPAEHEEKVPDEWPVSAKARVKEEAEKRRIAKEYAKKVEAERNQWQQTAAQLHAQLQQAAVQQTAPPATPEDPLADVVDGPGLLKARQQFWEMLEFAKKHPDGVDDYLLGTDAKGQEIRMDYSRDDIVKMEMTALEVLGQGIASKAAFLQEVDRYAHQAKETMPELFANEPNEANQIAQEILRVAPPQIRSQFARWPLYLVDIVKGEMARRANGGNNGARAAGPAAAGLSKAAKAVLGAPKTPVAPGTPRTRAVERGPASAGGRAVDIEKAKQAHIDSGFSSETLERLIAMKRSPQTGSRTPALV
jgi:hypothetical protein